MALSFTKATPEALAKMNKDQLDKYWKSYATFLEADNARLEEEKKAAQAKGTGVIRFKVSEYAPAGMSKTGKPIGERKGGTVGAYGLGQWPTSLYKEQWLRLIPAIVDVAATVKAGELRFSADFQAALDAAPSDQRKTAPAAPAAPAPAPQSAPAAPAAPAGVDLSKLSPTQAAFIASFLANQG